MSKAVLIMDMPESCDTCELVKMINDKMYCNFTDHCKDVNDYIDFRPDWCSLRELPEKKESDSFLKEAVKNDCFDGTDSDVAYFNGKDAGWNACLDKILKTDGIRKE